RASGHVRRTCVMGCSTFAAHSDPKSRSPPPPSGVSGRAGSSLPAPPLRPPPCGSTPLPASPSRRLGHPCRPRPCHVPSAILSKSVYKLRKAKRAGGGREAQKRAGGGREAQARKALGNGGSEGERGAREKGR